MVFIGTRTDIKNYIIITIIIAGEILLVKLGRTEYLEVVGFDRNTHRGAEDFTRYLVL